MARFPRAFGSAGCICCSVDKKLKCNRHLKLKKIFKVLYLQKLCSKIVYPILYLTFCNKIFLKVTEVGDMGSLKQFINEYGCSLENAMSFLSQIGEAVMFLHNRRFIHRNLRADSVFIYSNGNVRYILCFFED